MYQMIGIDPSLAANSTPQFTPGTHGIDDDGKVYKYLQYDTGTAGASAVVGEVAYYYLASGYNGHVCTSDLSDSVNLGAGVAQVVCADGEYAWFQIKGPATLTIALTAGADGNALTPVGSADGSLDVSGLVTDAVCAYADDISANEIVCDFPW